MAKLIVVFMVVAVFASVVLAGNESARYSSDGDFKILIIADTQDTDKPKQAMLDLVNAALDSTNPDLVVLLGDNIYGPYIGEDYDKAEAAIRAVVDPLAERNIPFTLVFGNHDSEGCISREEQLAIYQTYPNCVTTDAPGIPGCGNSYVLVGDDTPVVLWVLDSGDYSANGIGKYGYVTEEQNEWMLNEYNALCEEYGSNLTSYVFQHIPVPKVYDMVDEVSFGTKGGFFTYGNPFSTWYVQDNDYIWSGSFSEAPCSSEYDSGEFDTWQSCNVRAAFFGHDHLNDYSGTVEGIDFIATSGAGFLSYGKGEEHGVRLITINSDNPENYRSEMIYYKDLVGKLPASIFVSKIGVEIRNYVIEAVATIAVIVIVLIAVRKIRKKK